MSDKQHCLENFDEVNIESLKKAEIPEKAYRLIEFKHGSGQKIPVPSKDALDKTAKILFD